MLTCFQSNHGAQALYEKLGYELDETSPDPILEPELKGCGRAQRVAGGRV